MDKRELIIEMNSIEIKMDEVLTIREYTALRARLLELLAQLEEKGDDL